jgi:ribosomal protein S18 acetylase RimI-like enzyme
MEYICRTLSAEDCDEFYRLRLESLETFSRAFWETPDEFKTKGIEFHKQRLADTSTTKDSFIMGLFEGKKLIAMCGCKREDGSKGYHRATVWGMYVSAQVHGEGVGTLVLDETIRAAKQMDGIECLFLMVAADNLPAVRLYHSRGFRAYGIEPMSLKDNGEFVREFMMMKKL